MNGWSDLAARLGIVEPVFQAGMGGVATPALAAAVANAGGGGILGLYKLADAEIEAMCQATAARTDRPFGVNLVPEVVSVARLGGQVEAALRACARPPFITFFGLPDADVARIVTARGVPLLIQIGTPGDARLAAGMGADALIVQGHEAGGHHLGTVSLVELIKAIHAEWPDLPLIAAGGLAADSDLCDIFAAGACAVLMGTSFICAEESAAHPRYKRLVVEARAEDTVITDLFEIGWAGRPHRVLANAVTDIGRALPSNFIGMTEIMGRRYPVPRFSAAVPTTATTGAIEEMALYCGTSCGLVDRVTTAAEIVSRAAEGARAAWRAMSEGAL